MIELTARAIIEKDGKFLLVQLKDQDYWCLPGGRLEKDEPIVDALERELFEELGVKLEIGKLLFIHQLFGKDEQRLEFFFHVPYDEKLNFFDITKSSHGSKELETAEFIALNGVHLLPAFLIDELPKMQEKNFIVDVEFKSSMLN